MEKKTKFWALQVWSDRKDREFWDIAFWAREDGAEKGVATFLDATPRLQWMSNKDFRDVWAYLVEQRKLGRLLFSFTEENKWLMSDLIMRPADKKDVFPKPSVLLK